MPAAYTYKSGQVTLTNGQKEVTGVGTAWKLAGIPGGIIFAEGMSLPLDYVSDDTNALASIEWAGATGTYDYALVLTVYSQENMQNSTILTRLLAELDAGTIWKYDIAGSAADKATYDGKPKGFAYLVIDGAQPQLYIKGSATSGDWEGPFAYGVGPQGLQGIPGPAGVANPRGDYSGATAYARNDLVLYNNSSFIAKQATTGNAPPTLPTTSNTYWQLVAPKGVDGTGTGDVVGPAGATADALVAFDGTTGKQIKVATMPTSRVKGRVTAGTGAIEDLTAAQVLTLLKTAGAYAKDNILGTVSQSGGVPNGGIIERGSNANGSYVRFADGTQICAGSISYSDITTAFGSFFATSGVFVPTPAAAFSSIEYVDAGDMGSNNIFAMCNQTSGNIRMYSGTSISGSRTLKYFMSGRWF